MTDHPAPMLGMVNRVVPDDTLAQEVAQLAARIAEVPRFGLALAEKSVNLAEDLQGLRDTIGATSRLHHLAHAHNDLTIEDHLAGTPRDQWHDA